MAKGKSKLAGNAGNVIAMTPQNTLQALQNKAKGTPAEEWYEKSGQSYEQLRAMENIYDLAGTTSNVRSYDAVEKDPTLKKAMDTLESAPNGTIVNYQINGNTDMVMKKSPLGEWQSYEIHSVGDSMAVVKGGSMRKYNKLQAVNTITTLQAGALRKTLSGKKLNAFKGFLNG